MALSVFEILVIHSPIVQAWLMLHPRASLELSAGMRRYVVFKSQMNYSR
jgi:hypothetical protein